MTRVPIDPRTVRWAREVGRMTRGDLATRLGVSSERVVEIESGVTEPTFRQLTLIADALDRPLGFFCVEPPPASDVPLTVDFRGTPTDPDNLGGPPPQLVRELRRAQRYRDAVLEFDDPSAVAVPRIDHDGTSIADVAQHLRTWLGLDPGEVPSEHEPSRVLAHWRALLEQHGVLVFQTTRIPTAQFRGLSVHHEVLPLIILNGGDAALGRVFTLFHECAHLAVRTGGLCSLDDQITPEAWANAVAATALMPTAAVDAVVAGLHAGAERIDAVARHFRVSPLAAAVRLRRLGVAEESDVDRVQTETAGALARVTANGRVPAWRLRYRDLGERYIGTVARALESDRVDLVDATFLLSARLPMVERLLTEYYRASEHT